MNTRDSLPNRRWPKALAGACAVSIAMIAACNDRPALPTGGEPQAAVVDNVDREIQDLHPGERDFEEIAAEEPSFAGFFREGPTLVVQASDPSRRTDVKSVVQGRLGDLSATRRRSDRGLATVAVRDVEYSFRQLRDWRNLAFRYVLGMDGVNSLDLDERANRVSIGVDGASAQQEAARVLDELGVPSAAVLFEREGPIHPGANVKYSRWRALGGGLAIQVDAGADDKTCTFGFSAIRGSDTVFITNSHCTDLMDYEDGDSAYQRWVANSPDLIGWEIADPHSFSCGGSTNCRYSDAAVFRHAQPWDSIGFGTIIRTTWGSNGASVDTGSTTIDTVYGPTWAINDVLDAPMSGDTVHKVGMLTGWTFGAVDKTCEDREGDVEGTTYVRVCTYDASYPNQTGDSGAPVFLWESGSNVTLTGLHHGDKDSNGYGEFSPFKGLEDDLGNLYVYREAMNVTITGPEEVPEFAWCQWQSTVTGGLPPYSYSWTGVLSGSASSISGTVASSGSLTLTVTDALSDQDGDVISITVDEEIEECEF